MLFIISFLFYSECGTTTPQTIQQHALNATSPNFPGPYAANLDCRWYFVADPEATSDHFFVNITVLDINRRLDVLSIGSGDVISTDTAAVILDNTEEYTNPVIIRGRSMWITFTTTALSSSTGFSLDIELAGRDLYYIPYSSISNYFGTVTSAHNAVVVLDFHERDSCTLVRVFWVFFFKQ